MKARGLGFVDEDDVEQVPVDVEPNHAHIGPTYRDRAPQVEEALASVDPKAAAEGPVEVTVDGKAVVLDEEAYEVVTRPSVKGRPAEELHVGDVTVLVRAP